MTQFLALLIIVGSVLGVLYVFWRPHWAVLVVLVMFPLMQLLQVYSPFLDRNKVYMNITIGVLAVFAVFARGIRGQPLVSGYLNTATVCCALLLGWAAFSTFWSPAPDIARDYISKGLPYYALYLLLLPLLISEVKDMRRLWIGVMVIGTVIAILIMVNPAARMQSGRLVIDVGRFTLNPLATASLGGLVAILAAMIHVQRATLLINAARVVAFVSGLGLAVISGSRGQVVAAVIAGVLFYPMARRMANPKQFFTVAGGLALLMVGFNFVFRRFMDVVRWDQESFIDAARGRLNSVLELISMYVSSPGQWLTGLGAGAYADLGRDAYVHNLYAEVLAEQGIVGIALLAIMLTIAFKSGIWLWWRYRDDPSMRSTAAILLAVASYELIVAMKQGTYLALPLPFIWLLVIAKVASHERRLASAEVSEKFTKYGDEGLPDSGELAIAR